jgi:long-chain fatty acid transport protein
MGFGWTDQTIYKLGLTYAYGDHWDFRGGLNYGESTIPDDQVLFNLLAPATVELHLTLGLTYEFNNGIELSGSYVHAFENTISGPTTFPPLGSNPDVTYDNASISMKQDSLGLSLGFKF